MGRKGKEGEGRFCRGCLSLFVGFLLVGSLQKKGGRKRSYREREREGVCVVVGCLFLRQTKCVASRGMYVVAGDENKNNKDVG